MKNEIYFWIVIIAVILVAALYIRFFSSPAISLKVGISRERASAASIYPQQELFFNVSVSNTGSSDISQLGMEVLVNGNITSVYDATVPPGKTGYAIVNFTPQSGGAYNVSVVADPGKLYNIQNRQSTVASVMVNVDALQGPEAYLSLPPGMVVDDGTVNLDSLGFIWYSDLGQEYNLSGFNLTGMPGLAAFRIALDYIGSYAENMSIAHATYANGNTVYSIWLNPGEYRNVLPLDIVGIAAEGLNLSVQNYSIGSVNVTLVHLNDNESLCSWNSNGWIKTVTAQGNDSCLAMVGDNSTVFAPKPISGVKLIPPLISGFVIANDTVVEGNVVSEGYSAVFNQTVDFASVTENAAANDTCYGQINEVDNVSYCSSFVFPINGSENRPYLIRTRALVGQYNLTLLWRTNSSIISYLIPKGVTVLDGYNAIGASVAYKNGIPPQCSVPGFACGNATFDNGTLTIRLLNPSSNSVVLDSIGCVFLGATVPTALNRALPGFESANLSTACYDNGQVATSLPTGLAFTLRLNYTAANVLHSVNGTVYVVG